MDTKAYIKLPTPMLVCKKKRRFAGDVSMDPMFKSL